MLDDFDQEGTKKDEIFNSIIHETFNVVLFKPRHFSGTSETSSNFTPIKHLRRLFRCEAIIFIPI